MDLAFKLSYFHALALSQTQHPVPLFLYPLPIRPSLSTIRQGFWVATPPCSLDACTKDRDKKASHRAGKASRTKVEGPVGEETRARGRESSFGIMAMTPPDQRNRETAGGISK